MSRLDDLPTEILVDMLRWVGPGDNRNRSLKNLCLAGNRRLTTVARQLSLEHVYIFLKFPLPDDHSFYTILRKLVAEQPSDIRSLSFEDNNVSDEHFCCVVPPLLLQLSALSHASVRAQCKRWHTPDCASAVAQAVLSLPTLKSFGFCGELNPITFNFVSDSGPQGIP